METLRHNQKASLPLDVANNHELMQYVVKGSNEQWSEALKGKNVQASGTIQIQGVRNKRKAIDEEAMKREAEKDGTVLPKAPQSEKKSKSGTKNRKGRRSM
jgi:hypothetical protein